MRQFLSTLLLFLSLSFIVQAQETPEFHYAYTYHQPTGNRFIEGSGTFPDVQTIDYQLEPLELPLLISGIPFSHGNTIFWQVIGSENLRSIFVDRDPVSVFPVGLPQPLTPTPLSLLAIDNQDTTYFVGIGEENGSPLSHFVPVNGDRVHINKSGDLVLQSTHEALPLNALPDARIVVNNAGQIAVYTGANDQIYRHGVLGDPIEATEVTVLEIVDDQLRVITTITLPETDVFEGISPIWADVDEDGIDDLIVTVSNASVGAQIRAYRVDGSLLASGPAIGQGGHWRHQLAFGPFGPNGENELVDILTPHIGGVVEFYRLNGDQLEIVATIPGYTSHVIGTRNLDMAVAGDFNDDGQPEIVLPTQDRQHIVGLQHTTDEVTEIWRLPLDGQLTTNLSAVTLPDNTLALAAGTIDGRLRIWLPMSG